MSWTIAVLLVLGICYVPLWQLYNLRKNVAVAKASGLPYRILPLHVHHRLWIIAGPLVLPLLKKYLPQAWQGLWLVLIDTNWAWNHHYLPFQDGQDSVGHDTFLVVSPFKTSLMTADPAVISQITIRKNDFPKPIALYRSLEIYGQNVISTEGDTWRRHRKCTVPPFGEKNNRIVWTESIFQAQAMLTHWQQACDAQPQVEVQKNHSSLSPPSSPWSTVVPHISHDAMRLSLYVISQAGFGVRCAWPGRSEDEMNGVMSATQVLQGHKMSYVESLERLLLRLLSLVIFPAWLLLRSPFQSFRATGLAFYEWGLYMSEIYDAKKKDIEESKTSEDTGLDLMGALISVSGQIPGTQNFGKPGVGLSKEEILGNSFALFLAGHETSANTIHFSLLYLAMHPAAQRKLQADLDSIFADRDPSKWSYDEDLPRLFSGMTGAVMNEQLRLIPPITGIPKCTLSGCPQPLTVESKQCTVPGNTDIFLAAVAVQRNPKYWPHEKRANKLGSDLSEFRPDRWLLSDKIKPSQPIIIDFGDKSDDAVGIDTSAYTSETLFKPVRGAYIPFSDGARACLGRRFAQIEILAALAVILRRFSVELSVDEWDSIQRVEKMDESNRLKVWQKARKEVQRKLEEEMYPIITLQLRGKPVKVRICTRGNELFDFAQF